MPDSGEAAAVKRGSLVAMARVALVPEEDVVRPGTDPRSSAVTAMLVADHLRHAENDGAKAAGAELGELARAVLELIEQLGGDYLGEARSVPADLVRRAQNVRATIIGALEKALSADPEVRAWIDAVELGSGVVDLVYDLRTLAQLCEKHAGARAASAPLSAVQLALWAADALELALRTGETREQTEARTVVAKLWTLFVPAYERAAAQAGPDFPTLPLISAHRRAKRRPQEETSGARRVAPPPLPVEAEGEVANAIVDEGRSEPSDLEVAEIADVSEAVEIQRSVPPAASDPDSRRARRHAVEIEVGIASESNFYVGFTENLSSGGVFVATYMRKPIGSHVEVALVMPNGEKLTVVGVVRWLRDASPDSWPGMGVQFAELSDVARAAIERFLAVREPLFFDD